MRVVELASVAWTLASSFLSSKEVISRDTRHAIDAARKTYGIQGAVVSIVHGSKEQLIPLGIADARGNSVTEESRFAIASNSKLFTAVAIGLLIQNKTALPDGQLLDWNTKIVDIFPDEWKIPDEYASEHVDITDLLSMRSGMPTHDMAHYNAPPEDMIRMMRLLRPTAEIRQVFQYNNMHYFTLAHVVTTLSGMEFTDFVAKHIFDEVGMDATTYDSTIAAKHDRTDGFYRLGINMNLCREKTKSWKDIHPSCVGKATPIGWWTNGTGLNDAGPGGVVSCGKDMTKWLRELLDPKILPKELLSKYATPIIATNYPLREPEQSPWFYGMAQVTTSYRGHNVVMHTGGVPGQTSLILRVPERKIGVAVLTNDAMAGEFFYATAWRVIDDILGLERIDWDARLFAHRLVVPPKQSDPPADEKDITGVYEHAAYGRLDLTKFDQNGDDEMAKLLRDRLALEGDQPSTIYISPFKKLFSSHLALTYTTSWRWVVLHTYTRPDTHEVVLGDYSSGPAVITSAGIGMFGGFSNPGAGARLNPPVEEDVESRSEVWFGRV